MQNLIAGKVCYIAGAITGIPNYKKHFAAGVQLVRDLQAVPLNPAMLPEGLATHDAYMRITLAMLAEAECIAFLPGWLGSKGARMEHIRAIELGMECFEFETEVIAGRLVCVGLHRMPTLQDLKSTDLVALHQVLERSKQVWGVPHVK